MRPLLFSLALVFVISTNMPASTITIESTEERISLVELFSSEGCSSCPPAESWLNRLKQSPVLWKQFVPVDFHVDYWDYLGWRDPWGSKAFSERQHAYAALWRSRSVYTPGFVLNGKEWSNWSTASAAPSALNTKAGVLKAVSGDGNRWNITFTPVGTSDGVFEVHAALLGNGLTSVVKAGENHGRNLDHDFTALSLMSSSLEPEGTSFTGLLELSMPRTNAAPQLAVAFWITRARRLEPLQAAGGWLPAVSSEK